MTGAGSRPLGFVLLGVWLGALISSWVVAAVNFRTVDRVLNNQSQTGLEPKLGLVPADDRRMVLRHLASEVNRWMFRWWTPAQVLVGAGLLALAWSTGAARGLVVAALAITAAQALLTPSIIDLGRSIDFVPRPLPSDLGRRFGLLHASYVVADLVKATILVAAGWLLTRRPPP